MVRTRVLSERGESDSRESFRSPRGGILSHRKEYNGTSEKTRAMRGWTSWTKKVKPQPSAAGPPQDRLAGPCAGRRKKSSLLALIVKKRLPKRKYGKRPKKKNHLFNPLHWQGRRLRSLQDRVRGSKDADKRLTDWILGISQEHRRLFYICGIRPIMTFGSTVWWKGSRAHVNVPAPVQNRITGGFRTSPTNTLEVESSVPLIDLFLDHLRATAATRLSKLTLNHPITIMLTPYRTAPGSRYHVHPLRDPVSPRPPIQRPYPPTSS